MTQSSMTHLEMRECIDKKQENIVTIASFNQKLPIVKQIGSSISDIHRHMMKEATYPSNTVLNKCLHQRLQELSGNGLFFVSKNLFVCGGFSQQKACPLSADSILDVCMIVENMPVTILTLVQDNSEHVDETDTYSLTLAREVTMAVRSFCTELVSVLYGVVTERDINTTDNFQGFLKRLIEQNKKRYIPESLKMPNEKWKCITRAFAASIAITSSVFCDNTESLYFLTYEQFCILIENIEKKDVTVRTAPSSGGRTLIREVARRLEISGLTLLVMETEDQIQIARGMDTCSFTATFEEWKKKLETGTWSMGVINMVTNCQDCPPVPGLSGKSWTFIPGGASIPEVENKNFRSDIHLDSQTKVTEGVGHKSEEQLLETIKSLENNLHKVKEENEALRMIKKDLTSGLESVSLGGFSMDSGVGSARSSIYSTCSSVASGGANPEQLAAPEKHIGGLKVLKNLKKKLTSESVKSKKQAPKIPTYLLDNTAVYILTNHLNHSPIFVICQPPAIDIVKMNQYCGRVTSDDEHGCLVELHEGLCRTLQTSFSVAPRADTHTRAQYWETESDFELKGLGVLMEIGVTGASSEEMSSMIHKQANTWCIIVTVCPEHSGVCTQVWVEGKHKRCCLDTMPPEPGIKVTLRHGVMVDENGTVGFIDINRKCPLYKCHTLIRENLCQVFGVGKPLYNNPAKMKIISGNMITMTDEKQRLIYAALTNSSND